MVAPRHVPDTLRKQHSSAWVFPGSSREYPVVRIRPSKTKTAPTLNAPGDAIHRFASSTARAMYSFSMKEKRPIQDDEEDLQIRKRKGIKDVYQSDEDVPIYSDSDDEQLPTSRTHDVFEEAPKPKYLKSSDFQGQESTQETGMESFDLKQELQDGQFTESGVYIRHKDEFAVHDRWLEGITQEEMEKAREAQERVRDRDENPDWSPALAWKEMVPYLESRETVLQAIKRHGSRAATVPKWKKKPKHVVSESDRLVAKTALDLLTYHATQLLPTEPNIYEFTREDLVFRGQEHGQDDGTY
jgi:CD2 antigen cytoplasmic tail-binding protein 2